MVVTRRDGGDARESVRHAALAIGVRSPACHRTIFAQGDRVRVSRGDGDDVSEPWWHGALAGVVQTPARDGAIGLESDRVRESASDRRDRSELRRNRALGAKNYFRPGF